MTMRILVTGGAGYIGVRLAQALLAGGHTVTVLDNFLYGFEPALGLFAHYPRVGFLARDIRGLAPADLAGYDAVYHLAGLSGFPACAASPQAAREINVAATRQLVAGLSAAQLLVYASTTSLYGCTTAVCTEDGPVQPASVYATTKYEAEQLCRQHPRAIALRFATVFGVSPRMRWELMPNDFAMRAVQERALVLFDSQSVRSFLHIDDAVAAYCFALTHADRMAGQVYNVGAAHLNLSKRQLADRIRALVDFTIVDSTLTDPDVRNFQIRFDKLAALGYAPQRSLEDGLRELLALFRVYRPTTPYRVI
jgi:nucleoside-diphosphate-sugar epimerase